MRIKGKYRIQVIPIEFTKEVNDEEEEYKSKKDIREAYCWLQDTKLEEKGYCDVRKILTLKGEEKEVKYKMEELTGLQQKKVEKLLQKNEDIFIKGKYEVGRTNVVKHTIDTEDEKPIKQRARRLSVKEKELEKEHIEEML